MSDDASRVDGRRAPGEKSSGWALRDRAHAYVASALCCAVTGYRLVVSAAVKIAQCLGSPDVAV